MFIVVFIWSKKKMTVFSFQNFYLLIFYINLHLKSLTAIFVKNTYTQIK